MESVCSLADRLPKRAKQCIEHLITSEETIDAIVAVTSPQCIERRSRHPTLIDDERTSIVSLAAATPAICAA